MVPRLLEDHLRKLFAQYPVVTLTGPRQSGKTTLCRANFPQLPYVNLERPDERDFAEHDPKAFLDRHPDGAILDEIQRVPALTSWIQARVDERGTNGQYVLTESRQLDVGQAVTQSLAGRTALLRLLPFSLAEAAQLQPDSSIDELLHRGFYPRILDQQLDPTQALGDYFETYVERDLRQLGHLRNLSGFRTFVRLCAGRVGQLLNLSSLGADAGVSHVTAREWLSILEASFLVMVLPPFHANVNKRLIKSPKLYFLDVGLAAWLIGIETAGQVCTHPLRGQLFENLIVVEALKRRFNSGRRNNLCFYRDRTGHEVDLIQPVGQALIAIEAKSGSTIASDSFRGLTRFADRFPETQTELVLVNGGDTERLQQGAHVTTCAGLVAVLDDIEQAIVAG